jgi:hypothetical protein
MTVAGAAEVAGLETFSLILRVSVGPVLSRGRLGRLKEQASDGKISTRIASSKPRFISILQFNQNRAAQPAPHG